MLHNLQDTLWEKPLHVRVNCDCKLGFDNFTDTCGKWKNTNLVVTGHGIIVKVKLGNMADETSQIVRHDELVSMEKLWLL